MKWYYYGDNGKRVGPFSDDEFKRLAQTGVISPSTTVENEDGRRASAERVAGLFAAKAASTQSWETRFQKLTETVVEGGNVVDGKMNDFSKRLDGVAQTSGDLARRLSELETSSKESRNACFWRTDDLEKRFVKGNADLTKRADAVETRLDEKSDDLARQMGALEKRLIDASAELTKRVGDLGARIVGVVDLSRRVGVLENKDGDLAERMASLETSIGGARLGVSRRLDAVEKTVDGTRSELTKRVAELEKKGGASGDLTKRLDALETSVGGARSGLTKRVAELEKKSATGELAKRLDALEASGDRVTAYWEVVERQREVIADFAKRFASAEKSSDAKVDVLTKRVGELESRADASGVWTKRLDSLARRLETNGAEIAKRLTALEERDDATANASESTRRLDGLERRLDENVVDLGERLRDVEKEVGKRSPGLETSRAFEGLVEKLNGLGEALAAFDARFERLAERLDVLERRFDEETKRSGGQSDESRRDEPENREYKTTRPALRPNVALERESAPRDGENDKVDVDPEEESLKLDFWSDDDGESGEEIAVAEEIATTARRWEAGKYRVGVDLPPGRYQAEIRRGWASIELELADDYRCYVLETDPNVDGYAPRCVLEAPEGTIATLDNPVELTYLGALR